MRSTNFHPVSTSTVHWLKQSICLVPSTIKSEPLDTHPRTFSFSIRWKFEYSTKCEYNSSLICICEDHNWTFSNIIQKTIGGNVKSILITEGFTSCKQWHVNKCSIIVLLLLNVVEDVEQIYKLYWQRANRSKECAEKKFEWVKNGNWKSRRWKKPWESRTFFSIYLFRSLAHSFPSACVVVTFCNWSKRVDPLLDHVCMQCFLFFPKLLLLLILFLARFSRRCSFFLLENWHCLPLCSCIQFNSI